MKKRTYRSVGVKEVQAERLSEALGTGKVAFGVDVAKENFLGAFMGEDREVVQTVRWKSPGQLSELLALLGKVGGPARIEVALEPSGTYGDCLLARLRALGYRVFKVSPKRCHDAAELYDGVPSKHDAKDAAVIAKLHLDGVSRLWPAETERQRDLAAAVEVLDIHQQQYQQNQCRLEAKLARHWPELPSILDLSSATLLVVLEELGGPQQVRANPGRALETVGRSGRFFLAVEKREAVVESARTTIGAGMTAWEQEGLRQLARETNRNRLAANEAQKKVEQLAEDDPVIQSTAMVVGKVTAATLVVGLGDAADYGSAAAYVKAAGLNLKERSSGKHKGQLKITKRGPSLVRRNLYLAVLRLIQTEPHFKAWHAGKVQRMAGESKKKSVVALMRKLLGALWHVARGSEFDAARLFDARKLGLAPS
ncbi:MAG: IS110 family transposase [Deltaproteobacteria bacterium]|nr:IS110 family transposase [Deltaproteobacteria bacterium]